jgi:hypothetical protein
MGDFLSGLVGKLGGLFGTLGSGLFGKLGLNLSGLVDTVLVLGLTIFALTLGFFAIRYLSKRRETDQEERLAALIKGLHRAGISREVFNKPKPDAHDHLLRGLRWLLGGAGISGAMYGYAELQPANVITDALKGLLLGIIPASIGIAHLLFSWICAIRSRATTARTPPVNGYARGYARAAIRR